MQNADQQHQTATRISEGCGYNNRLAVRHLSRSAALEEAINKYEAGDGGQTAAALFFVVRSLCREFGFDYADVVEAAQKYAKGIEHDTRDVI